MNLETHIFILNETYNFCDNFSIFNYLLAKTGYHFCTLGQSKHIALSVPMNCYTLLKFFSEKSR